MKKYLRITLVGILLFFSIGTGAQSVITGVVSDSLGELLPYVTIRVEESLQGTLTDTDGFFRIELKKEPESAVLLFSSVGYKDHREFVDLSNSKDVIVKIKMALERTNLVGVDILENKINSPTFTKMDSRLTSNLPSSSGNAVEELIMTLPGVATNNELSSQYSVRGGNFDENLVYVNDIEVYRPLLIKSGQQEGLSFINSDLVGSISFSAGGFDASYGDKMSSVLDITYKRPTEFKASGSASMMGASAHLESASKNKRFAQLHGVRYKTSEYLLNTLNTKGEYAPTFLDYQTWLNYKVSDKTELSFLGNYSSNTYEFTPESRETNFGTYDLIRSLKMYFEGWEKDKFKSGTAALSLHYRPKSNTSLKLIASTFGTQEEETYDILGEYWLNEVDAASQSDNYGDSLQNIGVGGSLKHARNYLTANVYTLEHKGLIEMKKNVAQWGVKAQREVISDQISEWELRDSSGYSIPRSEEKLALRDVKRNKLDLSSTRVKAFIQDSYAFSSSLGRIAITGGVRASYWSFNEELIFSPRFSLFCKPHWEKDWSFHMAWGIYYQSPFYKEIRSKDGILNTSIKSQRSVQYVAGAEYKFDAWGRPFKYTIEAYYKDLDNLIPYDVNNVQIVYYGDNLSYGYTTGLDMRIFGEFVPGVDSWFSLSLMDSQEDLYDDSYINSTTGETVYPGYVSRPTDQSFRMSIFFQDYFPRNPNYRVQLKAIYGSSLPFGPPNGEKYQMKFKMPPYKRVDVGLSRYVSGNKQDGSKRFYDSMQLGIEVFNLLDIGNTNSYFWVDDVYGNKYAVPNYLTGRRLNLRISMQF